METLDGNSFSHLGSISLPHAYHLEATAVNPCIDVVALHRHVPSKPAPPFNPMDILAGRHAAQRIKQAEEEAEARGWRLKSKGKEREKTAEEREEKELGRVVVSLWRMAAKEEKDSMVWEKEIPAVSLLGMVWSVDGSTLSLLVDSTLPGSTSIALKLVHLSVHDGSLLHIQYLQLPPAEQAALETIVEGDGAGAGAGGNGGQKMEMRWLDYAESWPEGPLGSASMLLDSIVQPNPIKPWSIADRMKSLGIQNFQIAAHSSASSSKPAFSPTHHLASFPYTIPSTPPHVLYIPQLRLSLLGGTTPLPFLRSPQFTSCGFTSRLSGHVPVKPESVWNDEKAQVSYHMLRLGEYGSKVRGYVGMMMEGLELCGRIWREGIDKEHKEWLAKLENDARAQGGTLAFAQSDLTRLLLCGRGSGAITHFIGGSLTNNGLEKWSSLYNLSMTEMRKVLMTTVFAAGERVCVILEEMDGWLREAHYMDPDRKIAISAKECMKWAARFLVKVAELDRLAWEECKRFREFVKFMKYEIARATAATGDEEPEFPASHDVLLVCDYLDSVFVESQIPQYLWTTEQIQVIDFDPPVLPEPKPEPTHAEVMAAVDKALARTHGSGGGGGAKENKGYSEGSTSVSEMFSPILNRRRRMSINSEGETRHAAGAGDQDRARSTLATPGASEMESDDGLGSDVDESTRRKVQERQRKNKEARAKALWPIAVQVMEKTQKLMSMDGPLNVNETVARYELLDETANWMTELPPLPKAKDEVDLFTMSVPAEWVGGMVTEYYREANARYIAWLSPNHKNVVYMLILRRLKNATVRGSVLGLELSVDEPLEIVDLGFFDNRELHLLAKPEDDSAAYLSSVIYSSLEVAGIGQTVEDAESLRQLVSQTQSVAHQPMVVDRSRALSDSLTKATANQRLAMASNGRVGRRLSCVLGGAGSHLETYDVDIDDSDDVEGDASMGVEVD